jgi:diaminohydroxyphosphoribosylaminopyrimidine deaminase/5-amino-6-(5-phosphoribosylamino)uracil reductase
VREREEASTGLTAAIFRPLEEAPRWVVGQLGQSLDGQIATGSGHSHYVTGPLDLERLHHLRALADAVVVGAGTVAADNPRLTVRRGRWRERPGVHPLRVVLDPRGTLSPTHHLFQVGDAPTLWLQESGGAMGAVAEHVEVVQLPPGGLEPAAVVALLRRRGAARILVEGGGVTVSRFLAAGLLDRLHLVVAPLLVGPGRQGISLPPVERLDQALRPRCRTFALGADVLFDLEPRVPAEAGGALPEGS